MCIPLGQKIISGEIAVYTPKVKATPTVELAMSTLFLILFVHIVLTQSLKVFLMTCPLARARPTGTLRHIFAGLGDRIMGWLK